MPASGCGRGVRSSHTMSTMRRPQAAPMRGWPESAAGIDDAPGSVRPSTSVDRHHGRGRAHRSCRCRTSGRCRLPSPPTAASVMLPARFSLQYFQTSRAGTEDLAAPVAAQHRTGRHEDRRQARADRTHDQPGRGLVAAAHQHGAVEGMASAAIPPPPSPGSCDRAWSSASRTAPPATSPAVRPGSRRPAARRA